MRKTANIQSYSETPKPENISGISRVQLPKVLPYPAIPILDVNGALKNVFCYIIKGYGNDGLSVLIYRQKTQDQVVALFGDWNGNNIDIIQEGSDNKSKLCTDFTKSDLVKILEMMRIINIEQAQFFFGIDEQGLVLCDVQISINKMVGPGMVKDVFGKIIRTQEVIKTEILDDRAMDAIIQGTGSYEGDLIIKPSRFRLNHTIEDQSYAPLYAKVIR